MIEVISKRSIQYAPKDDSRISTAVKPKRPARDISIQLYYTTSTLTTTVSSEQSLIVATREL